MAWSWTTLSISPRVLLAVRSISSAARRGVTTLHSVRQRTRAGPSRSPDSVGPGRQGRHHSSAGRRRNSRGDPDRRALLQRREHHRAQLCRARQLASSTIGGDQSRRRILLGLQRPEHVPDPTANFAGRSSSMPAIFCRTQPIRSIISRRALTICATPWVLACGIRSRSAQCGSITVTNRISGPTKIPASSTSVSDSRFDSGGGASA